MISTQETAIFTQNECFLFFDTILGGLSISEEDACADDAPTDAMDEEEFAHTYESMYGCPPPAPMASEDLKLAYGLFYGTLPLSLPSTSAPPLCPALPPPGPDRTTIAPPTRLPKAKKLNSSQRRGWQKTHDCQQEKRKCEHEGNLDTGQTPPSTIAANHILPSAALETEYNVASIPSGSTGFKALPNVKGRVHTLDELVNELGFTLIKTASNGRACPIADKNGLVIAIVISQPCNPKWASIHTEVHNLFLMVGEHCRLPHHSRRHHRGSFTALNVGISFGRGQKVPGNLVHSPHNTIKVEQLLPSKPFARIAQFCSSAFATWALKLHSYYKTCFDSLLQHHPALNQNFKGSVWAAAAFNCSPQTITAHHCDFANLPFGWCSVTALGEFDYEIGGHVVLWEAKLVIELLLGHTILLPSAAITHSNTPIQPGKTQMSFTQYSAGGIFQWAEHGFQTEVKYRASMTKDQLAQVAANNLVHTKLGLALFSKLSDLCHPRDNKP